MLNHRETLSSTWKRIETQLAGPLDASTRRNMRVELFSAVLYGVFIAALLFVPAILTRLGGSPGLISVYLSLSYLGHVSSSASLFFVRRFSPKAFAVVCWTLGRMAFVLMAFATNTSGVLVLAAILWLLEVLPNPAYTRILQSIYPIAYRGKIMALVRFGMALTILIFTPIVGWALDRAGYQVVLPIAGLMGIAAALVFIKLTIQGTGGSPAPTQSLRNAVRVVARNKRFVMLQLGVTLFGLGGLSANPLYPDVQINRLGLSYTQLGLLGLVQSASWLLGYFIWGRLIDRYGSLRSTFLTFAISAVPPFTYAFASTGWMLLPAFIGIGLVSAGADISLVNSCLELSDPDHTQEYAVAQSTVIGLRGLVAPFLGVGLLALGVPQPIVFVISGLLALSSAFVVSRIRKV